MTLDFAAVLPPDRISVAHVVREQHSHGESYDRGVLPDVVLYPQSTEEVAGVLRMAYEAGVAVTPVGANSSLEGHTVPVHGGISLDLSKMNRVLEFVPQDFLIVVQAGVTYPQINETARRSGLFFPIDPGAHATLGGMVSTRASGTMAVRYGVTGDYVLALEVVLANGDVIRTGTRARKSSAGYDLCALFTGAEGTLGVITEVTVKLVGLPEAASAARVPFDDAAQATTFVTSLIQAGVPVARCELIDPPSIRAVNQFSGTSYPEQMTVFLEFHGNPEGVRADTELARELAKEEGALAFEASEDPAERERLWEARHKSYYAEIAANPGKRTLITDVAVPLSRLPEAVTTALADCKANLLDAYLVGHVGDGNFHLTLFLDEDGSQDETAEAVVHRMVSFALSLGGTSTGEHGVGLRKLGYMVEEHGASLDVMRAIKRALDPTGILNPGKKLPT